MIANQKQWKIQSGDFISYTHIHTYISNMYVSIYILISVKQDSVNLLRRMKKKGEGSSSSSSNSSTEEAIVIAK